jgi:hypothetical protein
LRINIYYPPFLRTLSKPHVRTAAAARNGRRFSPSQ